MKKKNSSKQKKLPKKKARSQDPIFDMESILHRMVELNHQFRLHGDEDLEEEWEEYRRLLDIVSQEFAPLLTILAKAGALTALCLDGKDGFAAFEVEEVNADGILTLMCVDVVGNSVPAPQFDFVSEEGENQESRSLVDLNKIKFDKRNPN